MGKLEIISSWLKREQLPEHSLEKKCCVWVDLFNGVENYGYDKKFFLWVEPEEYCPLRNNIINNSNNFDYILTYDDVLLKKLKNAVLFEYGTTWIDTEKYDLNKPKEFSVSTICGNKKNLTGHKLRHDLWFKQNNIKIPKKFYTSENFSLPIMGNPVLGRYKEPLFDSMFHICIENVSKNNFFTEKIIDPLVCKTIPIYLGCPNISNYFDTRGFLVANNVDDIINICNNLTIDEYYNRMEYININYEKALKYSDIRYNLVEKIKTLI